MADFCNQVIDIHTLHRYGMVLAPNERPWEINFYGANSARERENQSARADAMNAGILLVQSMQMMKDMGANEEIMEAFLSKTMKLDQELARQYAKIVDAKPPGGEDMGMGGGGLA
jgi:hypothetical protein